MLIKYTELEIGDIVLFEGAEFEITTTKIFPHWNGTSNVPTMSATGKWLSGRIVPNYFGPETDFQFQGNDSRTIELSDEPSPDDESPDNYDYDSYDGMPNLDDPY